MRGAISLVCLFLFSITVHADEVFQFRGNSYYSGKMSAQTRVSTSGNTTTVQVLFRIHATAALIVGIDYWMEELTTWSSGELQTAATNTRYMVNDEIKRQSWKAFTKNNNMFEGYKIESKHPDQFKSRYPLLATIWELSSFGKSWLPQFYPSSPDRRSDYDVAVEPGLQTPLAFAFYYLRFLQNAAQVPVFVVGEEREKRVDLVLNSPEQLNGTKVWRVPFRAGPLKTADNKPARAEIGPDQQLHRLKLSMVHTMGSAEGELISEGCVTETSVAHSSK